MSGAFELFGSQSTKAQNSLGKAIAAKALAAAAERAKIKDSRLRLNPNQIVFLNQMRDLAQPNTAPEEWSYHPLRFLNLQRVLKWKAIRIRLADADEFGARLVQTEVISKNIFDCILIKMRCVLN